MLAHQCMPLKIPGSVLVFLLWFLNIQAHRISFTEGVLENEVIHRVEGGGKSGWEWHCCCKLGPCSVEERTWDNLGKPNYYQNVRSNGDLICCTWDWSYFKLCPSYNEFKTSASLLLRNKRDGCQVPRCQGQYGVKLTPSRVKNSVEPCDCEQGFRGPAEYDWEHNSWSACQAIPCPKHAHGHPDCECRAGFQGQLTWNGANWEGVCVKKACPQNSDRWPLCKCKAGFTGNVVWKGGRHIGECMPVGCPENAVLFPECKCRKGFQGNIVWNVDKFEGQCRKVECPRDASGHPKCNCNKYFSGRLVWNGADYKGECVRVSCPKNSEHWPTCACIDGYTGKVEWSRKHQGFRTTRNGKKGPRGGCMKVPCPANSALHPKCQCLTGFVGEISWVSTPMGDRQYLGSCTELRDLH